MNHYLYKIYNPETEDVEFSLTTEEMWDTGKINLLHVFKDIDGHSLKNIHTLIDDINNKIKERDEIRNLINYK